MTTAIHPEVRIGHVHLTVSNLERALPFYRDALGFEITQRYGTNAVFLSAGGYHHHIALNVWAGEGAPQPPPGRTGLYHLAVLYPSRQELARAFKRLFDHGVLIEGASDHGVSEAIYLRDPDGNGVELYRDRPQEEWPRVNGQLRMTTGPLDLDGLLNELHDFEPKPETSEAIAKLALSSSSPREARAGRGLRRGAFPIKPTSSPPPSPPSDGGEGEKNEHRRVLQSPPHSQKVKL